MSQFLATYTVDFQRFPKRRGGSQSGTMARQETALTRPTFPAARPKAPVASHSAAPSLTLAPCDATTSCRRQKANSVTSEAPTDSDLAADILDGVGAFAEFTGCLRPRPRQYETCERSPSRGGEAHICSFVCTSRSVELSFTFRAPVDSQI